VEEKVFEFVKIFISIVWEAFPFVVLGAIIAGILEEVVPQQAIAKLVPKNPILAVAIGGVLGLVFPMCECGIVPVMRRLLRKGLPLGTCVAYMLAGPIINLIVIGSTWIAFKGHGIGMEMVALRIGLAFLVAIVTAMIVQAQYRKFGNSLLTPLSAPQPAAPSSLEVLDQPQVHPSEKRAGESRPLFQRLSNISETSLHDFIDIMVFLTIGSCLAALVKVWGPTPQEVQTYSTGNPGLTILGMMVMAILMCLCSEADAFVAASFKTMHPSAKLSFLVLGPMFDLKLLLMFTRVFRRRIIVTIILSVFIQVFVYSMAVHFLAPYIFPPESLGQIGE
jgi:uncharacterized membrane protein YraQ (UPF0718 family)